MGNPLKSLMPSPCVLISCPLCHSHMQVALILLNDLTCYVFFLLSDIVICVNAPFPEEYCMICLCLGSKGTLPFYLIFAGVLYT